MATRPIFWVAIAALAFGSLLVIAGEIGGGGFGALAQGYGLLVVLSGLFIVGGLTLRHFLAGADHSPADPARPTRARVESIR